MSPCQTPGVTSQHLRAAGRSRASRGRRASPASPSARTVARPAPSPASARPRAHPPEPGRPHGAPRAGSIPSLAPAALQRGVTPVRQGRAEPGEIVGTGSVGLARQPADRRARPIGAAPPPARPTSRVSDPQRPRLRPRHARTAALRSCSAKAACTPGQMPRHLGQPLGGDPQRCQHRQRLPRACTRVKRASSFVGSSHPSRCPARRSQSAQLLAPRVQQRPVKRHPALDPIAAACPHSPSIPARRASPISSVSA